MREERKERFGCGLSYVFYGKERKESAREREREREIQR
jgi:hypothetical protein